MLLKELKNAKGAVLNFLLLAFYLIYFGRAEIGSSKTAYLIVGVMAILAFFVNQFRHFKNGDAKPEKLGKTEIITLIAFGVLFGLIVVFANYAMFLPLIMWQRVIIILLLFCSSFVVFIDIFLFFESVLSQVELRKDGVATKPVIWFLAFFVLLAGVYLTVFYLCSYPGQICSDSLNQIKQTIYGDYSNHHPVYQTWIIGFFMKLGYSWFGDNINDAVATYTVFQILFMSASFSFMLTTMIQAGSKRLFTILWLIWFMFTPCHIIFSFTIWKDSIYGACVCLFTVALFRIIKKIGKHQIPNYILLTVMGIAFNLLRSNGLPAFLLLMVILPVMFYATKKSRADKENKRSKSAILLCCLGALIIALILKFPVLKAKNIPQADTIEMLSIPVQQVTRVALEKNDLTLAEREVIDQIGSIDLMVERYNPRIYDYARDAIRYDGNQDFIKEHPLLCLKTWMSVVSRHPFIAAEAWVDQTSGYWNPGNYYWMKWWDGVCEEEGLYLKVNNYGFNDFFHNYVRAFTDDNSILLLTYNVGLHVWIILFSVAYCIYKKRKDYIYALPALCLVATLLIATLMHDEFRFGYAFYTCLPIIVFSCISYKKNAAAESEQKKESVKAEEKAVKAAK